MVKQPVLTVEVRRVDNQHVAFPVTDGVAAIRRRDIVAMSAAVDWNDLEPVIRLGEQYHELRGLNDLSDVPLVHEADVRPDHARNATECGVVFFAEWLRLCGRLWLLKAGIPCR